MNLKFRIWSNKLKELVYFTFDDIGHAMYMMEPDVRYVWSKDHVTVIPLSEKGAVITQFTGLIDKNDKGIYIGDYVKVFDFHERKTADRHEVCYGKFNNGYMGSHDFIDDYIQTIHLSDHGHKSLPQMRDAYEVIGNIWENKEK